MNRDDVMTSRRAAGAVLRYHTWPTVQQQTVAEHSWRVAQILLEVFTKDVTLPLLRYALTHDAAELHTGDVPYHVKKKHPELKRVLDAIEPEAHEAFGFTGKTIFTEVELAIVKICDLLEMYEFGLVERALGSKFADPIVASTRFDALRLAEQWEVGDVVQNWCWSEEARYA